MRRITLVAAVAALLLIALPSAASAGKPSNGCPNAASGWMRVNGTEWLRITLEGFAEEGIDTPDELDEFSREIGFVDWQDFAAWIIGDQWAIFNRNGNDFVCIKDLPNTPGIPGYIVNGVDDQSSAKGGV